MDSKSRVKVVITGSFNLSRENLRRESFDFKNSKRLLKRIKRIINRGK